MPVLLRPLRLRMKVFEVNGQRYLVAAGVLSHGGSKIMASAMSDLHTFQVEFTIDEWNALPFHWFQDEGEAPRRTDTWPPKD